VFAILCAAHIALFLRLSDDRVPPPLSANDIATCVCVGSVWKSYSLLSRGFRETLFPASGFSASVPFTVRLMLLEVSSAVGAAFIAAKVP
jgi:hypothetical protein